MKQPAKTAEACNKVWIELLPPVTKEFAEEQCKLANRMMKRLAAEPATFYDLFWYSDREKKYCFNTNSAGTYLALKDNGHWLNLDYLAGA